MKISERAKRFESRRTERTNYESMWDDIARFTMMVRKPFTMTNSPGGFLNDGSIFANIGVTALRSFSSAIMGACWRGASVSSKLVTPFLYEKPTGEVQKQFVADSAKFAYFLDNPKTGMNVALSQAIVEFGNYGTGAIAVYETEEFPYAKVRTIPLESLFLTEDNEELFIREEISGPVFAKKYETKGLPETVKKKLTDEQSTIKVVVHFFPRPAGERAEAGILSKPYGSVTFLPEERPGGSSTDMGVQVGDEDGYDFFPVMVGLNNKLTNEPYGRGQGGDALPALMEMNACRELFMLASEFKVEPVLWSYATSFNNGKFNKSPGALNIPNLVGAQMSGGAPVGAVHTIGSVQELLTHMEALTATIKEHFYIDKLFDLNNQSRMTLGEAMIRKTLRDDAVSPFYLTIFSQLLNPALMALASIYRSRGLILQKLPQDLLELSRKHGIDPYEIRFTSAAARGLRSADLKNYLDAFGLIGNATQLFPEVGDNFQADVFARRIPEMAGIDEDLLFTETQVLQIRAKRAASAKQMRDAQIRSMESGSNQKDAQALQSEREGQAQPFVDGYSQPA